MTESAVSSVHTKSSTIQKTLKPSYRETLLQSCEDELLEAEYIYSKFDYGNGTEKLYRLRSCRTGAYFYRNHVSGEVRVGAQSCHLRFCPLCSKSKVLTIKYNVAAWLESAIYPKILTFTIKHYDRPLVEQLNKLYDSFQKIRRLKVMKSKCKGGVWFFQVKKSTTDGLWHPHIHCLVSGAFIPQSELKQKWFHITGDSKVVDIRSVKDAPTAARHVSRYAAKPASLAKLSLDECYELADALKKRRLCGTWGICKKLKITSTPEIEKKGWYRIGSWNGVFQNMYIDDNAKQIVEAWRKGVPLPQGITIDHLYGKPDLGDQNLGRASPKLENQSWFNWSYSK